MLTKQVVAPGDRVPKRAMAGWRISCAARQQRQRLPEPLQECLRRQDANTGGSQLEGQREPIKAPADLRHTLCVLRRQLEITARISRALDEERNRLAGRKPGQIARAGGAGQGEWRHEEFRSPRNLNGSLLVARIFTPGAPRGDGCEWRGIKKMLKVVEEQEKALVDQIGTNDILRSCSARVFQAERLHHRRARSAGSASGARSTKTTPSRKRSMSSPATAVATRVLPLPPAPVRVSRRTSSSRSISLRRATSRLRPTRRVGGIGSRCSPLGGRTESRQAQAARRRSKRRGLRRRGQGRRPVCARSRGGVSGVNPAPGR